MINEDLNILLAGDDHNVVIQYDLTTGQIQKNYGDLRINDIVSIAGFGPIAIIGGWRSYLYRVLFLDKRQIFGPPKKTGVHYISSIQFCLTKNPGKLKGYQMLLAMAGYNTTYHNFSTDIFNITELIKFYKEKYSTGNYFFDFDSNDKSKDEIKNDFVQSLDNEIKFQLEKTTKEESNTIFLI